MNDMLFKLLPMLLSMTLSQIIYMKIDKRYDVTNKISLKLGIDDRWRQFFFISFVILIILIIGILGIYVIDISSTIYFILSGVLTGIGIGMQIKSQFKKTDRA